MAKFLKFIVNTIMIVAIVVAASLLIPPFAGVTTVIVDDIEMETNLDIGSVTYAWGVNAGELNVGDKVLLQEDGNMLYTISAMDGSAFILEDTLSTDGEMMTQQLQGIVDKVIVTVPVLGYVSMALRTVEGLIIVGLSVVFVIILFILAEIWRKEEEDWEEDEEDSDEDSDEDSKEENTDKKDSNKDSNKESSDAKDFDENNSTEDNSIEERNSDDKAQVDKNGVENVYLEIDRVEKDLLKETNGLFATDVVGTNENKENNTNHTNNEKNEKVENPEGKVLVANTSKESREKVLAMPLYTTEEWMERAKAAGDEPELVVDEISGVTFLDYSDVI